MRKISVSLFKNVIVSHRIGCLETYLLMFLPFPPSQTIRKKNPP